MKKIGLGDINANIVVYCQNIPPLEYYEQLTDISPMTSGEISMIADKTGNHWRKIFNVYAKFIFELCTPPETSWQLFRDNRLLTHNSDTLLLFTPYEANEVRCNKQIDVIMGKQYANSMVDIERLTWLSNEFAIDERNKLVVCPYFDYRQLSNEKITKLCGLIKHLKSSEVT